MGRYTVKVYIVQQADKNGMLNGPVLAAKLTYAEAHAIAKEFAPANVTLFIADKTALPNNPEHVTVQ
jgi:hypothetical protein